MQRRRYTDADIEADMRSQRTGLLEMAAGLHLILEGRPETYTLRDASFLIEAERVFWEVAGPLP